MLILIKSKVTEDQIKSAGEDLDGYVKFVVDLDQKIMTIGGSRHVEGEQLLLEQGSKQGDLWGGGYDPETSEIDFDSMINIRPNQGNSSREVLDLKTRTEILKIVKEFIDI